MAGLCILTDRQEARVGNGGRSKRDVDGAVLSANQTFRLTCQEVLGAVSAPSTNFGFKR